jgi:hypothetical protein
MIVNYVNYLYLMKLLLLLNKYIYLYIKAGPMNLAYHLSCQNISAHSFVHEQIGMKCIVLW